MHEQTLEDVLMPAQVRPPHAPGLVEMVEGAFDVLAAASQERLAVRPLDASAIPVDGACASGMVKQSRRPRSGSATYDRTARASRSIIVWLL
jgi:hypothetical protein